MQSDNYTTEIVKYNRNKNMLLRKNSEITMARKNKIYFDAPLLHLGEMKLIFRNTTNLIQGQTGVHKSRILSQMITTIIGRNYIEDGLKMIYKDEKEPFVIHFDTEQEATQEFAYMVQTIIKNAGYSREDDVDDCYFYSSLVDIQANKRLSEIRGVMELLKEAHEEKRIIVFIDVLTDLVEDFNNTKQAQDLIDFVNKMRSEFGLTFVSVIHENMSKDNRKAVGHVGSQFARKSTTIISIERVNDTLFKLLPLKMRRSRVPKPLLIKYSDETKQLELANEHDRLELGVRKVDVRTVVESLVGLLKDKKEHNYNEIKNTLMEIFEISDRTLRNRLKDILENNLLKPFGYKLVEGKNGRNKTIKLSEI